MFEGRKRFREILNELDRLIDNMEKEIEDTLKSIYEFGSKSFSQPIIYGFSMKIEPNGKPILKLFGDKKLSEEGFREPFYDQFVDESKGELKLIVELPGVEKEDIDLNAIEDELTLSAFHGDRKYKAKINFKIPVDPESAFASYRNGILEVTFKIKDKTNKKYTKIKLE
ncbi:MAG: Hsp20/alpha crystallin family protein [Nitrososphaerales archaeon]